jgi:ribosomal-protein-serine acetyltransferase
MLDLVLRDFPDEFETERLIVRAPQPGTGPLLNVAVRESLEALRAWMPWADHEPSIEESEDHCRRALARFLLREDLTWHLWLKDGTAQGTFAGGSGLHRIDWTVPKFEIGYWLRTSLQGRGLMTEAAQGIANFAFERLEARRVEIRCDARNEKSANVARRAGFELEGCLRQDARDHHGTVRDTLIFSRVRQD